MSVLVIEGLELMLVGMLTVFTFLTLLVFFSMFMSHLVSRFFSEAKGVGADHGKLIAVISAAVAQHRNR